jgi:SSS family solute:Na+ symporter
VVVSAVFAAAMDPNLNSMATLTYCDIYQRYFRPQASDREGILVLRIATLAWGAICTLVGIAMIYAGNILDAWWKLSGLFSGGVLGLFLLGFFGRRVTSRVAAVAVGVQVLAILWATISQTGYWPEEWKSIRNPLDPLLTVVVAMLVVIMVGFVGSFFATPAKANGP